MGLTKWGNNRVYTRECRGLFGGATTFARHRSLLANGLCYLVRVYGIPTVDGMKDTRTRFLALKWPHEPGRIVEHLEAFKRRLTKLRELDVIQDSDDYSSIINGMRKAIKESIVQAGGEERGRTGWGCYRSSSSKRLRS